VWLNIVVTVYFFSIQKSGISYSVSRNKTLGHVQQQTHDVFVKTHLYVISFEVFMATVFFKILSG